MLDMAVWARNGRVHISPDCLLPFAARQPSGAARVGARGFSGFVAGWLG